MATGCQVSDADVRHPYRGPSRKDEMVNRYYDEDDMARAVAEGRHRGVIGGLWDELGTLQFEFLTSRGLLPQDRLIDIGCGSLRAGVKLVDYLDAGNYYGVDASQHLLDAGYEAELESSGLAEKMPREQLRATSTFDVGFGDVQFDIGLAQSVFTHLTWNHLRLCLQKIWPHFKPDGVFFATFFLCSDEEWPAEKSHDGGIVTKPDRDPFHYTTDHIAAAATGLPWTIDVIGAWDHPRDQRMVAFQRT